MKLTELDPNQIVRHVYDTDKNANRMTLVDGIQINTDKIESAIKDAFKNIKIDTVSQQPSDIQVIEVPVILKEQQVLEIEKQVIVKEYEKIEVPVIIEKVKIVEVERPIIVQTTQVIEIEKQIVVKEQQIIEVKVPYEVTRYTEFPSWIKYSVAFYLGISLLLNLIALFKK